MLQYIVTVIALKTFFRQATVATNPLCTVVKASNVVLQQQIGFPMGPIQQYPQLCGLNSKS